jgi:hypothetical protein
MVAAMKGKPPSDGGLHQGDGRANNALDLTKSAPAEGTAAFAGQRERSADLMVGGTDGKS